MLVVTSDMVLVNTQAARTGRIVCDGDHISTDKSGVGDLIISGDHESDSIHFAENTDPSVRWTGARCVSVDRFRTGTVIVHSRKHCMIVRTPDVLVYQPPNSRNLFAVKVNAPTELKAFYGAPPVKLKPLSEAQVRGLTAQQVQANLAPAATQPRANSTNFYKADTLAAPARTLTPAELKSIETMRVTIPPNYKAITRP